MAGWVTHLLGMGFGLPGVVWVLGSQSGLANATWGSTQRLAWHNGMPSARQCVCSVEGGRSERREGKTAACLAVPTMPVPELPNSAINTKPSCCKVC